MKSTIFKAMTTGMVAIILGLSSAGAAHARHWYSSGYYYNNYPGYWRSYSSPVLIDRGDWRWRHHHDWYGRRYGYSPWGGSYWGY